MKFISVTYHSNYNGVDISSETVCAGDSDELRPLEEEIIDWAVDMCDDNGHYYGDEDKLKDFITGVVERKYPDAKITIEIDDIST